MLTGPVAFEPILAGSMQQKKMLTSKGNYLRVGKGDQQERKEQTREVMSG